MLRPPYQYFKEAHNRYSFISKGNAQIKKVVVFSQTGLHDVYNIGFGDRMSNGSIDDTRISNNGDIVKILVTVIQIVKEFTIEHRDTKIAFSGSTEERTKLYFRILKTYYAEFGSEFLITVIMNKDNELQTFLLNDWVFNNQSFFIIERKN